MLRLESPTFFSSADKNGGEAKEEDRRSIASYFPLVLSLVSANPPINRDRSGKPGRSWQIALARVASKLSRLFGYFATSPSRLVLNLRSASVTNDECGKTRSGPRSIMKSMVVLIGA